MMSRRRRVVFAAMTIALVLAMVSATIMAVDVYLHGRYQRSAGFNVWGYRGTPIRKKSPGEYRLVVLGGSAAYGYGVTADEAIPAVLERLLRTRTHDPIFTVVNLGYNNEGAYSFKATLEDYAWLEYDLAVLYEGYNDLSADRTNTQIFRRDSPVFRLTGYMPIFPIIFREKAAALARGNDPDAVGHGEAKTSFHASLSPATSPELGKSMPTSYLNRPVRHSQGRVPSGNRHDRRCSARSRRMPSGGGDLD